MPRVRDPRRAQSPILPTLRRIHGGVANVPVGLSRMPLAQNPGAGLAWGDERRGNRSDPFSLVSSASINAQVVKPQPGFLYSVWVTNINAAIRYLKLYDLAIPPVPAIHTPVWRLGIPGNAAGAGGSLELAVPLSFYNGIAITLVQGPTDIDSTAVAAAEILVSLSFD